VEMINVVSAKRNGALARRKSGVDRRVVILPGEYRTPLAKLYSKYHGTAVGQVGPLVRRLESYGNLQCLVMGANVGNIKTTNNRIMKRTQ
jgi:hypothetical protein